MGQLSVTHTTLRLLLLGCMWGSVWTDVPQGRTTAPDISRGRQQIPNQAVRPEVGQDLNALDQTLFAPSLQHVTQDTEYQEARPHHARLKDKQSLDTNILDPKSLDTKSLDTKSLDSKSVDTKSLRTESLHTKSLDTKSLTNMSLDTKSIGTVTEDTKSLDTKSIGTESQDTKSLDTKSIGTESQDTKSLDTKSPIATSQNAKIQDTKLQDAKLQNNKVKDDKLQHTKPWDNKPQDTKTWNVKLQNTASQDAKLKNDKLQDTKPQDTKLQDTKSQDAKHESATSKDAKLEDTKSEKDKLEDSTRPGHMVGIPLSTSDRNVPRDVTPTGATLNLGSPQMSTKKVKAGEGTLQQGMLTTTSSLMDLLFQNYLASSFQELADASSGKSQESGVSNQSPTDQIKVPHESLGLFDSALPGSDKPLEEVTLSPSTQSPVATQARDKQSPVTTEAHEHNKIGARVGKKGKVLRVISELDNRRSLEEMESQQSSLQQIATDFLNSFRSGPFPYEFDSEKRNKDLPSRENRVEKPDLGFLAGNRPVITYTKSVQRPQEGHREMNLIIRIRQVINDGFNEDMSVVKKLKSPLVKVQNEFKFSADKERNNISLGDKRAKVLTRGRHVFGRHLMSYPETPKTGSTDSKQPLTKGEIESLFVKSSSDDSEETGAHFKTGKESPSSSGAFTFTNQKKARNNMETSGTDLSEDKKTQASPEEVTILPILDSEDSQKQLNLPPNVDLSPEKDRELDELVDRLQDSYILDFGRKKQSDFKDFEDPDEENESGEKVIKSPQVEHKMARMFHGRSKAVKMSKRSVEDGSGYYGVSVDDRNDNDIPKEYDVEVDNGVKTERFSRSVKQRRIQRRAATKTTTSSAKNQSEVTTEGHHEKEPMKPAVGHTQHHEHGSSIEGSGKVTKVVGVLLIPFPSNHKQEPAHHVPFHTGHHTGLAGADGREVHIEHHAGMHHKHPCHYGVHHFGHDDRHPCHPHHHHPHHHHPHHIHMHPHNGMENSGPYPGFGTHHQIHHHGQGEPGHAPHHGNGRLGVHDQNQNPFFVAHSTDNKAHQGGHGSRDHEQITVMTGSHSQHANRTANGLHVLVILAICFILFTVVLYFIIRSRSGHVRETNSRTALYVPQAKY